MNGMIHVPHLIRNLQNQERAIVVNSPRSLECKMASAGIDPKSVFLKAHDAEYEAAVPQGHFRRARIRGTLSYEYDSLKQLYAIDPAVFSKPLFRIVDWEDKTIGYFSEFINGRPLVEYYHGLDGSNRSECVAVIRSALIQVADTIALVHSKSAAYGDFTTENTLVTASGTRLVDPDPLGMRPFPKDRDIRDVTSLARGALNEGILTEKECAAIISLFRR